MKGIKSFSFFVSFLLIVSCIVDAQNDSESIQPNIIFIMADDLGWGELNNYGNDFNETPNLNKLASQGMRFTQAYAAVWLKVNFCSESGNISMHSIL